MVARNWETGELVWNITTGSGGIYNDNYEANAVGKNGRLYQGIVGGILVVEVVEDME